MRSPIILVHSLKKPSQHQTQVWRTPLLRPALSLHPKSQLCLGIESGSSEKFWKHPVLYLCNYAFEAIHHTNISFQTNYLRPHCNFSNVQDNIIRVQSLGY